MYPILFGLFQVSGKIIVFDPGSSMWISSVAGLVISKIFCASVVTGTTRAYVRILDILWHKCFLLKHGLKVGQRPAFHR